MEMTKAKSRRQQASFKSQNPDLSQIAFAMRCFMGLAWLSAGTSKLAVWQ
jgi:hypothetical protein